MHRLVKDLERAAAVAGDRLEADQRLQIEKWRTRRNSAGGALGVLVRSRCRLPAGRGEAGAAVVRAGGALFVVRAALAAVRAKVGKGYLDGDGDGDGIGSCPMTNASV